MLKLVTNNGDSSVGKLHKTRKAKSTEKKITVADELKINQLMDEIKAQVKYIETSSKTWDRYILGSSMANAMVEAIYVAAFELYNAAGTFKQIQTGGAPE